MIAEFLIDFATYLLWLLVFIIFIAIIIFILHNKVRLKKNRNIYYNSLML